MPTKPATPYIRYARGSRSSSQKRSCARRLQWPADDIATTRPHTIHHTASIAPLANTSKHSSAALLRTLVRAPAPSIANVLANVERRRRSAHFHGAPVKILSVERESLLHCVFVWQLDESETLDAAFLGCGRHVHMQHCAKLAEEVD